MDHFGIFLLSIWNHIWIDVGITLVSLWDYFETILGPILGHFEIDCRSTLGLIRCHFGTNLGLMLGPICIVVGVNVGITLGTVAILAQAAARRPSALRQSGCSGRRGRARGASLGALRRWRHGWQRGLVEVGPPDSGRPAAVRGSPPRRSADRGAVGGRPAVQAAADRGALGQQPTPRAVKNLHF